MRQPCASFAMHSSVQVFLNISGGGGCVVFTGKSGKPRRAGSPPPGKDADGAGEEGVGAGSGKLPGTFLLAGAPQASLWPETRISHAQQQPRRKSLLLQK